MSVLSVEKKTPSKSVFSSDKAWFISCRKINSYRTVHQVPSHDMAGSNSAQNHEACVL
jgi:hypothetical protein